MIEISVIVPVYNVEQFLKTCVQSILDQTFTNLEVILVNDGSQDNSGKICDEFAVLDQRVHVIHQKNTGLSGARNRGIQEASGKYVCFVDSDDYIAPDFCEIMYRMLELSNNDFCVCRLQRFQDDQEITIKKEADIQEYSVSNQAYLKEQLLSGFSACAKLYRKEIFEKNKFHLGKIHEDIIWSADLARNLHKGVCCTSLRLYYYRQNNAGIMASNTKRCSADRVYAGKYLFDIVKQLFPEMLSEAFKYGIMFPWSYVDGIYVHKTFAENKKFLKELKNVLAENRDFLKSDKLNINKINRHRMVLFSYSLLLYGCNAYARLIRLYVYRIIRKDAYKSGHGI